MPPQKTSYPKQDIKILLLEGISQNAVDTLLRSSGRLKLHCGLSGAIRPSVSTSRCATRACR